MLVRRISIENVRSFLDREELSLDGQISIVIGPNGGGKTNLLDTMVVLLRRYLFASMYAAPEPSPELPGRHVFRYNDQLNNMVLDRHSSAPSRDQVVEIEIEITQKDIDGMRDMKKDAPRIIELAHDRFVNITHSQALVWEPETIQPGTRVRYKIVNMQLSHDPSPQTLWFLQFLQMFEMDGRLRDEFELAPLPTPLIYLPVNRAASGFQSSVQLAGYNQYEMKRQSDAASSRNATQIVALAIGRLALKYRLLLEKDNRLANEVFREDANLRELTMILEELGYSWELKTVNPATNQYDVQLTKQGSSFLVGSASSGERELLTYLFAIFALNVRDALIIVDEPELHLHPKWQKTLLMLFVRLSETTGNQFVLATHSPTFISPESIQYVSRVFSKNQCSHIARLNSAALPESKHLLNVVNSQNNERLFFADEVVLVEGISDRIFFEAILDRFGRSQAARSVIEVVNVGGKGLFSAYSKILRASKISFSIIADLDYIEQIGTVDIKSLFRVDDREIKVDVIDNIKSMDGAALVGAIDSALSTESWDHARSIWDYIKSRRRQLLQNLNGEKQSALEDFIGKQRGIGIFLLNKGTIESYLPAGYASKDLEKLIKLLSSENFWDALPSSGRAELELIARTLLGQSRPETGVATVPAELAGRYNMKIKRESRMLVRRKIKR